MYELRPPRLFALSVGLLMLASLPAYASDDSTAFATASVKVGGSFNSLVSGLDTTVGVDIEGGILLLGGKLEIVGGVGYLRPPAGHQGADPRVGAGEFAWHIDQDVLTVSAAARYRFLHHLVAVEDLEVYGAIGPRLYLLQTTVTGTSGDEEFGENRQVDTELGGFVAAGAEYTLGPGALLGELGFAYGGLHGKITGPSNAAALSLHIGYRMFF